MTTDPTAKFRRLEWLLPTFLAVVVASGVDPLVAIAGLVLLCYLPGRLLVSGFRLAPDWDAAGRTLLAVVMSLAVTPLLLNPIWHVTNQPWPLLGYSWALLSVGYGVNAVWRRSTAYSPNTPLRTASPTRSHLFDHTRTRVVVVAIALLVAFAAIGPYWPVEPRGYPVPAQIHDFIKHHAVLFSLEQRPLPLGNPFFAGETDGPTYYYHFFYLIPATIRAMAPSVSTELAFGIQATLIGVGTAGMCYLIVKRFTGGDGPATLAALLSTVVGGLDIIPLIVLRMKVITLDAWADALVRIHNLLTQIVWTPQNVSGLLIFLLGAYLLSEKGWWRGWLLLGPVLGASLIGSTIWIAAAAMPALAILVVLDLVRRRQEPESASGQGTRDDSPKSPSRALKRLLASGVVALLMLALSLPMLSGYLEMSQRHGKTLTADWPHQHHALLGKLAPPGVLANVLDLPWVLALEFGPLLLFPIMLPRRIWRRAWNDSGLRLLMISAGVALLGFVTLRSHFTYNDFGQKIMLAAQAAGVVLGACILAPESRKASLLNPLGWRLHDQSQQRRRRALGWFVGIVVLLGLPVGCFQSPLAAVRRYFVGEGPLRALAYPSALRAASESGVVNYLRHELPSGAVIQAHAGEARVDLLQLARRQIGVMELERDTMVFYPVDLAKHQRALQDISAVLTNVVAPRLCRDTLRRHRVTHVFVGEVEREHWQVPEKFADPAYFDLVYEDAHASVYALR